MKIELKNIKVSEIMSEETTAFVADIFVDGVKAGYAKNDGHGGCTFYHAHEGKRELIAKAEAYLSKQPKIKVAGLSFELDSNLETKIDMLLEDYLKEKDKKKIAKKLEKAMIKSVVWGKPNSESFYTQGFKTPLTIEQLLAIPKGKTALENLYRRVKTELKEGEEIFNKNLVEIFG